MKDRCRVAYWQIYEYPLRKTCNLYTMEQTFRDVNLFGNEKKKKIDRYYRYERKSGQDFLFSAVGLFPSCT